MTTSSDDAPGSDSAEAAAEHDEMQGLAVDAYWATARDRAGLLRLPGVVGQEALGSVEPPAWSFGTTPAEADELLALVLAGLRTAAASAAATYSAEALGLPTPGDVSIILDGHGRPRALIATTAVEVRPFHEVDEAHAAAEGEGDGSLAHWRHVHEEYLTEELAALGETFDQDIHVVLERYQLLDPKPSRRASAGRHGDTDDPAQEADAGDDEADPDGSSSGAGTGTGTGTGSDGHH